MRKQAVLIAVISVVFVWGCRRKEHENQKASDDKPGIQVQFLTASAQVHVPRSGGSTDHETLFTFQAENPTEETLKLQRLEAVWYIGNTAVGAATCVDRGDGDIIYHYALGDSKQPPDVVSPHASELSPGMTVTYQLKTTGNFGWPEGGLVDRKLVITVVVDGTTHGPFTGNLLTAPSDTG